MKRLFPIILSVTVLPMACQGPDDTLPAGYREIPVPIERLESSSARERGRQLFLQHCALCHGKNADGRGERREGLSRPPADFTSTSWRSTVTPRLVYFSIREGVRGTPMPSWKALKEDESWELVAYLLSLTEPRS